MPPIPCCVPIPIIKPIHESSLPPPSGFPSFFLNIFIPKVMLQGGSFSLLTIWGYLALPYRWAIRLRLPHKSCVGMNMHFPFTGALKNRGLRNFNKKWGSRLAERFCFLLDCKNNEFSWFEWSEPYHDIDVPSSLVRGRNDIRSAFDKIGLLGFLPLKGPLPEK